MWPHPEIDAAMTKPLTVIRSERKFLKKTRGILTSVGPVFSERQTSFHHDFVRLKAK
jgi:hypothetical protein